MPGGLARTPEQTPAQVFSKQLIPAARQAAGLTGQARVGFLGYSMGGFGGLLLASRIARSSPSGAKSVLGVAAMSAALWTTAGATAPGAYDDAADFRATSIFNHLDDLVGVPVRLACGTSDPFISGNRALQNRRPATSATFDTGGHTEDYWRSHAPSLLAWLAGQL